MLQLERWGATPEPAATPLGSILDPRDAAAGRAFCSEDAAQLFVERRSEGWGLDPLRIQGYLTSSQGLTLNLLAPLHYDLAWASRTFGQLLDEDLVVERLAVEFAPPRRSLYLGDQTRIDAVLRVRDPDGHSSLVAMELKLCDRWSSRFLDPSQPRYREAADATGAWDQAAPELRDRKVNQLFRSHLLASLVGRELGATRAARMLLVSLESDDASAAVATTYQRTLRDRSNLTCVSVEATLAAMLSTARGDTARRRVQDLELRYVRFSASEPATTSGASA